MDGDLQANPQSLGKRRSNSCQIYDAVGAGARRRLVYGHKVPSQKGAPKEEI
jgi:hypothetical protein